MHPHLLSAIARQREEDLRRAAQQHGLAGPHRHRLVYDVRTGLIETVVAPSLLRESTAA